ncbi:transmembrane protein, putative (macronuclear) [Tetrahymena thermophila SB210]|uniref:Transmembrane protein, putative n=1 Tax=Tetrahymena thermophila (strain SB210) TaxID=312017 RepID=W7XEM0_TETTS|nr:transmembrane protein, putative [Tetrahymena thermophila SB210]EWS75158.1 transmembrane protein, putative [Tetrahymena thermophila SB210]|eukprot:XP_012652314.1 transmembrane protein, putative [Tetrahymena thermophila SB210]
MNYNNQDIYNPNFQVAQHNNIINPQPYLVGQPIDKIPNNNFGYQYPKQNVEVYPISYQQNPAFQVNPNPNIISIQYSSPEVIYCTASIRSTRKHYNNGVGVNGIINALQQIYSELNLVIPNLDLIGRFNFLSTNQMENKVFQPMINNNRIIQNELIRNCKVFYCCKTLQSRATNFIIIMVSSIVEFNSDGNNNTALRFAIQIPCIFILMFSLVSNSIILVSTKRFLVLVKQLDQNEFVDGNCI